VVREGAGSQRDGRRKIFDRKREGKKKRQVECGSMRPGKGRRVACRKVCERIKRESEAEAEDYKPGCLGGEPSRQHNSFFNNKIEKELND
jgi:hypothetical protein